MAFSIRHFLYGVSALRYREKAEDKVRLDRAGQAIQQVFINRENLEEVAKTISNYMTEKSETSESLENSQTSNNKQ